MVFWKIKGGNYCYKFDEKFQISESRILTKSPNLANSAILPFSVIKKLYKISWDNDCVNFYPPLV